MGRNINEVESLEDMIGEDDDPEIEYKSCDKNHRNYDEFMNSVGAGTRFMAAHPGVPGCRRRSDLRLGVSRLPFLEPLGAGREAFYQFRLLTTLPWWSPCPAEAVTIAGIDAVRYTLCWTPPSIELTGVAFEAEPLIVSNVDADFSWEERCQYYERLFCEPEISLVCLCCAKKVEWSASCRSCLHAVGWHFCRHEQSLQKGFPVWKAESLYAGKLDIQRVLFPGLKIARNYRNIAAYVYLF